MNLFFYYQTRRFVFIQYEDITLDEWSSYMSKCLIANLSNFSWEMS